MAEVQGNCPADNLERKFRPLQHPFRVRRSPLVLPVSLSFHPFLSFLVRSSVPPVTSANATDTSYKKGMKSCGNLRRNCVVSSTPPSRKEAGHRAKRLKRLSHKCRADTHLTDYSGTNVAEGFMLYCLHDRRLSARSVRYFDTLKARLASDRAKGYSTDSAD